MKLFINFQAFFLAIRRFFNNYDCLWFLWWHNSLTNPDTKMIATKDEPFNTDSGKFYVKIEGRHSRSYIKRKWMDISPNSIGLPMWLVFRASNSLTNENQIDLKIANSKHPGVASIYNFHLNCRS